MKETRTSTAARYLTALRAFLGPKVPGNGGSSIKRAGHFLTQTLLPLEATQRAAREANRNLLLHHEAPGRKNENRLPRSVSN